MPGIGSRPKVVLSRVELVAETMRAALEVLSGQGHCVVGWQAVEQVF
jgi:hypothetical protein